jgi:hypothetical protein
MRDIMMTPAISDDEYTWALVGMNPLEIHRNGEGAATHKLWHNPRLWDQDIRLQGGRWAPDTPGLKVECPNFLGLKQKERNQRTFFGVCSTVLVHEP